MEENKIIIIQDLIYEIRGHKVMFDHDLANLYGVSTPRLNEAVKRNIKRFPEDFMFQLSDDEWKDFLRSQNAISKTNQGGRRYAPFVFTEQGVAMLAAVLKSQKAIDANICIMRAFVKLRHFIHSQIGANEQITELHKLLMLHIENSENKFLEHDRALVNIINALNNLIEKPKETKRIGFYKED